MQIDSLDLKGNLDLSDFINLEQLQCWKNQLTNLILPKGDKLKILGCSGNQLTSLDLINYVNLGNLNCSNNQLTQLILSQNNQLEIIYISNNFLTSFNYDHLSPTTLKELLLFNNNLVETNLSVFSPLINLVRLEIDNEDNWVKAGKFNKFFGSLESLKNLTNLESLFIANTNINTGLEYLPGSLKKFSYYSLVGSDFKVQEVKRELKRLVSPNEVYKGNDWKTYWLRIPEVKAIFEESKNWIAIHSDFVKKPNLDSKNYQELWQEQGFSVKQAHQYLQQNFFLFDYMLLVWLRDNKKIEIEKLEKEKINSLRKDYQQAWTNLDAKFAEKAQDKTYQQIWETYGVDYDQAQEWIKLNGVNNEDNYQCWPWKWIKEGFAWQTVQSWITAGLKVNEAELAVYLQEQGCQPNKLDIQSKIKQKSWRNLHPEFTYSLRQKWEQAGYSYQETREWVEAGFEPKDCGKFKQWKEIGAKETKEWVKAGFSENDYSKAKGWKDNFFTPQQAKQWIDKIPLGKSDYDFANYLRNNHYSPENAFENKSHAQHWLDWQYPEAGTCIREDWEGNHGEERNEITELDISDEGLCDSLSLKGFISLEEFNCYSNEISKLDLNDCSKLVDLICWDNELTELDLINCKELVKIDCSRNKLTNLNNLNLLVNLEELEISNNEELNIPLDILSDLPKLKKLSCYETRLGNELTVYGQPELIDYELDDYNYIDLLKTLRRIRRSRTTNSTSQKRTTSFWRARKNINYLETRINELFNLIKVQKQKIINSFINLLPEKELIQELITKHLEIAKLRKKGTSASEYREQNRRYKEIRRYLEDNYEEMMEGMEIVFIWLWRIS